MSSIIRYVPASTTTPTAPSSEVASALDILRFAASGTTRPRKLQALSHRLDLAKTAAGHIEQIQQIVARVTRASETCARDIAALRADVAAHDVRRFACEFQKDQIERERAQLPERMREHDELASLEHQVAKARLQAQLDEFEQARRARTAPNARASTTPNLDAERAAMERERALTDARRIVEDVSAEHIPMDARQPYHAFAGCVYLTERLNGATPADAAAHTRTVVADRIASGAEMTLNDRLAHKFQYDMLKPRLDGAAKTREGVVLLDALHKMGAGNGSERPA